MRFSALTAKSTRLIEMPQKVEPTDFELGNLATNRAFLHKQLPLVKEVIQQTENFRIVLTGDGRNGWIFLQNLVEDKVDYTVQYAARNWSWMARTVTQCILWRDASSPYAIGITRRMFYDYLLPRFKTILSDRMQTPDGNQFWMTRMVDATLQGHRVGIVNMSNHTILWYDPRAGDTFQAWLASQNTYGEAKQFQALRYIIADQPLPAAVSL